MKTTDFAVLVNKFIMEYLVSARNMSPNTVLAYRDAIVLLVTFMSNVHGIKPEALEIADINAKRVEEFLDWLESERSSSIATRNIRLAAIHSLFRHTCSQQPELIFSFTADTVHTCKENSTDRGQQCLCGSGEFNSINQHLPFNSLSNILKCLV